VLRNVLPSQVSNLCVLCDREEESSCHLFLHCEVEKSVWLKLMMWLDCFFVIPPNLFIHWECWCRMGSKKKVVMGLRLIWHTTIWLFWKARNDKIYKNYTYVVEEIKFMSWRWMLYRIKIQACLFYEWSWNPQLFLIR